MGKKSKGKVNNCKGKKRKERKGKEWKKNKK